MRPDQHARMHRLVSAYVVRKPHKGHFCPLDIICNNEKASKKWFAQKNKRKNFAVFWIIFNCIEKTQKNKQKKQTTKTIKLPVSD